MPPTCNGMMPPGIASLAGRCDFCQLCHMTFGQAFLGILLCSGPAHAFAGEFDPMGVVNEAVQDGIGISWIAYNLVPSVHERSCDVMTG